MKNYDERCKNCQLYKKYADECIDEHKDESNPYGCKICYPKDRKNNYSACEEVMHFILSPISLMHDICFRCTDCNDEHKCNEQCCLADIETDRMVYNSCRYSLHRFKICMYNCDEDKKKEIRMVANKIIQFLWSYSCHCNYKWDYFRRKISRLRKQYQELFFDDKADNK